MRIETCYWGPWTTLETAHLVRSITLYTQPSLARKHANLPKSFYQFQGRKLPSRLSHMWVLTMITNKALSNCHALFSNMLTRLALTKTYEKDSHYLSSKVRKLRNRKLAWGCSHGKSQHHALNHHAAWPVCKVVAVRNKYFITWISMDCTLKNKLPAHVPTV